MSVKAARQEGIEERLSGKEQDAMIGTFALIPQLVAAVPHIPIVAAGGVMNGQGLVAAFTLGAEAVQMGSAF